MNVASPRAMTPLHTLFAVLLAYVLVVQLLAMGIAQAHHLGQRFDPAAALDPSAFLCLPGEKPGDGADSSKPAPDRAHHDLCCTLPLRLDAVIPEAMTHPAGWTRTAVQVLRPMVGLDAISPRGPPQPLNPRAPPLSA